MGRQRKNSFLLIIMLVVLLTGMVIGSGYAAGMKEEVSSGISDYLYSFFENAYKEKTDIFISSVLNNLKIFSVIFFAGFFKVGTVFTAGIVCMEGFVSGFTNATLIKLMGWKGFFIGASGILSVLVFVGNLIFYSAFSVNFAVSEGKFEKKTKKQYITISVIALTIFCIASLLDGYITTIFMEFVVNKM